MTEDGKGKAIGERLRAMFDAVVEDDLDLTPRKSRRRRRPPRSPPGAPAMATPGPRPFGGAGAAEAPIPPEAMRDEDPFA